MIANSFQKKVERSRSRSLEEENELARSIKKVKDSHHASDESRSSRGGEPSHPSKLSFKDKLVGDILRAYSQAFVFMDQMEADSDSEELEEIREGFTSVCLSKKTKQHIRAPWTNVIIVKVFGKNVGYNYLHSKLLDLWKLNGRVDMVDLGRDFFFLLRFSVDEDLEMVLKKGPWFVGGHFLSIWKWEASFKPSEAIVSSVAMWVRLNELSIGYYKASVLRQIEQALGTILRVDMHTALEARSGHEQAVGHQCANRMAMSAYCL